MKMHQYFDVTAAHSLAVVATLTAKMSQLNSLILFISDDSFRNWDSVFQDDMHLLVAGLTSDISGLQKTVIDEAYLLGFNAQG